MTTKLPTSMTGIHHDLHTNRQEAANARKKFVAIGLTKQGKPYKVTAQDIAFSGAETREAAEAIAARMTTLNPGKRFTVIAL